MKPLIPLAACIFVGSLIGLTGCSDGAKEQTSSQANTAKTTSLRGKVTAVDGGAVTIATDEGSSVVSVTSASRVTKVARGDKTAVQVGKCARVNSGGLGRLKPTPGAAPGAMQVSDIQIGEPIQGVCVSPNATPGQATKATKTRANIGLVTAVTDTTFTYAPSNGAPAITITPPQDARYWLISLGHQELVTVGLCAVAKTEGESGNLTAQSVNLNEPQNGECAKPKKRGTKSTGPTGRHTTTDSAPNADHEGDLGGEDHDPGHEQPVTTPSQPART